MKARASPDRDVALAQYRQRAAIYDLELALFEPVRRGAIEALGLQRGQALQADLFIWHGYTELLLGGRWVKATPAFNLSLCERFGLLPLDWDGREDSLYHPYDREGRRHMEYVHQRGSFDDVPLARSVADFAVTYAAWREPDPQQASFDADVARETS